MTTYAAQSIYGYCQYTVLPDDTLEGFINFYDLHGSVPISAAHIHSAVDGEPVLVWLLTSKQWENGVAQATPGGNCPCCRPGKCANRCTLQAPSGTPYAKNASYTTYTFHVSPPSTCTAPDTGCGLCPWISQGTLLNFHGKDFQFIKNGCPVGSTPGADMVDSVPFTPI